MHVRKRGATTILLMVVLLVGLAGCGSAGSGSSSGSSTASQQADSSSSSSTSPTSGTTRYAVLYKIFPDGGFCSIPGSMTAPRGYLQEARDAGLPAKITDSADYPDQHETGGFCLEYGRFATPGEAQAAIAKINAKMSDPQLAGGDGNAAAIYQVATP